MFGFHQPYETQSSGHPGPEMEKGRSGGKTKGLPPEPALTGPAMEVSSPNESWLFTYTTSDDVVPPGSAPLPFHRELGKRVGESVVLSVATFFLLYVILYGTR